jgi:lipoate-protein ligase A
MLSIPQFPYFKNFSLLKMQTFSHDLFAKKIVRVKAVMVRREQAVQSIDNIFRSRFGLMFSEIDPKDQKIIDDYVTTFASNLVYLQTMIDSFNTDEEMKFKTRALATILGYKDIEKIALLRSLVTHDYRSLQWL